MATFGILIAPYSVDWQVINADDEFVSRTGAVQIQGNSGARWQFTLRWRNLSGSDLRIVRGIHARQKGRRNRLRIDLSVMSTYQREGSGATSPTVLGAHSAGATEITFRNGKLSENNIWRAGDFITIGEQLFQLGEDYDSDANGDATLDVWPPLHKNLTGGESVDDVTPSGVFFLREAAGLGLVANPQQLAPEVSFVLEEDVLA